LQFSHHDECTPRGIASDGLWGAWRWAGDERRSYVRGLW
jgi:hypothetical protein